MISFEFHLEKRHEKTQKPLWFLGFPNRYLFRFAMLGIDRNFDRRSILGCIPPFGWGAFYVIGVQMGCIYFPYHHFVACFITLSHFFAALLRERLLGPKTMKGVYKSASITFLLKVFFRLLAMVSTSLN